MAHLLVNGEVTKNYQQAALPHKIAMESYLAAETISGL